MDGEVVSVVGAALVLASGAGNHADRQAADAIITAFKKSPNVLTVSELILLHHADKDSVLFFMFSALKDALLNQWSLLTHHDIRKWKTTLMEFAVTKHANIAQFVIEQLCLTLAVVAKRSSGTPNSQVETNNNLQLSTDLVSDISQLLTNESAAISLKLFACTLADSLLNEFNNASSSVIGQCNEFHQIAKYQFQNSELLNIFKLVVAYLHKQSSINTNSSLVKRLFALLEKVFTWDFTSRHLSTHSVTASKDSFRPPGITWRAHIIKSDLLQFMVQIRLTVLSSDPIYRHWFCCMAQLASVTGPGIFLNNDEKVEHLSNFIHILNVVCTDERDCQRYCYCIALLFNKLASNFTVDLWKLLPISQLQLFFDILTKVTSLFCESFLHEEVVGDDDHVFCDALQLMLNTWVTLLADSCGSGGTSGGFNGVSVSECSFTVFSRYVQCHLSVPTGLRPLTSQNDDIDEVQESDRDMFSDQLNCVAMLGRACVDKSINLLTLLLESSIDSLHLNLASDSSANEALNRDQVFEDVHWLMLMSAHVLADEVQGETPTIPYEILECSLRQSDNVTNDVTIIHTAFISYKSVNFEIQSIDPVIRLVACFFHYMKLEDHCLEHGGPFLLSPEVSCDFLYFMSLLNECYILVDDNRCEIDISNSLKTVFGNDSGGGQWLVDTLVHKVLVNVLRYNSESSVIEETLSVMLSLVEHNIKAVLSCNAMNDIIQLVTSCHNSWNTLPGCCCRILMQSLLRAAVDSVDMTTHLLDSMLIVNMSNLMSSLESCKDKWSADKISELIISLELMRGCALACHFENSKTVYSALNPVMPGVIALANLYHYNDDVINCTLQVFIDFTCSSTPFMTQSQNTQMLQHIHKLFQTLLHHKLFDIGEKQRAAEKDVAIGRLELALQLLNNIISMETMDVFGAFNPEQCVSLVLFALGELMPFIQTEALQVPVISTSYYGLLSSLFELQPDSLCSLDIKCYERVIVSLEGALTTGDSTVAKSALECVSSAAVFALSCTTPVQRLIDTCQHLMYIIIECLIDHTISRDIITSSAETLLNLIQLLPSDFTVISDAILAKFPTNHKARDRLTVAFSELLAPLGPGASKTVKPVTLFKNRLDKFLDCVGGLLVIR